MTHALFSCQQSVLSFTGARISVSHHTRGCVKTFRHVALNSWYSTVCVYSTIQKSVCSQDTTYVI